MDVSQRVGRGSEALPPTHTLRRRGWDCQAEGSELEASLLLLFMSLAMGEFVSLSLLSPVVHKYI